MRFGFGLDSYDEVQRYQVGQGGSRHRFDPRRTRPSHRALENKPIGFGEKRN